MGWTATTVRGSQLGAIAVTVGLWASAFPATKLAVTWYAPPALALLRLLTASVVLGIVACVARVRVPRPRDLPALAALGLFGSAFYQMALAAGQTDIDAGAAGLLANTAPLWTALFAYAVLGERPGSRVWLAAGLGFLGVAIVSRGQGPSAGGWLNPGVLWTLTAAVSWGVWFTQQKRLLDRYTPLEVTCYGVWLGTALLLPAVPALSGVLIAGPPLHGTLLVLYLGALPTAAGYLAWAYAMRRWSATRTTLFLYLTPVVAVIFSWLWLAEKPHVLTLCGGAIVLAALVLPHTSGDDPSGARGAT